VFGSCREAVDLIMSMVDADRTKRPESLANWVGQLRRSSLDHPLEVLAPEATGRLPQPSADGGKRVPVTDRDRQIPRVGRVRLDGRNLRDRPRVRRRVAVVGLAAALVLAVWHDRIWLATTDRPTATPTTIATATAIPINADLIAGAWSGNAADGAGGHFDVVLDIRTGCGIGQRCGSIHVSSNNCTGDLSLYAINRSGYEFSVNNFSAASGPECSPGAGEYLQPLEKGSLLYTTGYNPGIRAVLKSQ
jgi:hypothetical protein